MPGLAFSTSFVISSKTASRSFSNTTWLKLIKRTALFNLAWSKNVYCCWYRSILIAGSPRIVKYSAGRSGVALANTIWWASVVLPLPGAPAMMLKENSGRPPPRISSRPGIPVGSLLIFTLSCWVMIAIPPGVYVEDQKTPPHIEHQTKFKGFADERRKQPKQLGNEYGARLQVLSAIIGIA